jgi:hypothetical protein
MAMRCFTKAVLGCAMLAIAAATEAQAQQVLFQANQPLGPWTGVKGDPDWKSFFSPDAPWQHAASQIQILSLGAGYVGDAPDAELREIAAWAAARGIALNIVLQPVAAEPSESCGKTEGYDNPKHVALVAAKLKRLGVAPKYISLDGPLWFGHYATGPQDCHLSIEQAAQRAVRNLRFFLEDFSDLDIDDIEGDILVLQPNWQAEYRAFKTAFEGAAGHPVNSLRLDVKWTAPGWGGNVKALHALAKSLGLKFGVIYNGDDRDDSDAAWVAHAIRNYTRIESEYGIIPDRAAFVSWNKHPSHALPETSPDTMTWLIDQYRLPRTRFEAQREGSGWRVKLVGAAGRPLAGQKVTIARLGVDPARPPPVRSVSGIVPKDAAAAILGLRVNAECFCASANDLLLGDMTYEENGGGSVKQALRATDIAKAARGEGIAVAAGGSAGIRLQVPRDRQLIDNSVKFAVTPGAHYEFRVPLGSVNGDGLSGTATIIWLNAEGKGLFRTNLGDDGDRTPAGTATTDRDGGFAVKDDGSAQELSFAGNAELRPALARLDPTKH